MLSISLRWANGRMLNTQSKIAATKLERIKDATNLHLPYFNTFKTTSNRFKFGVFVLTVSSFWNFKAMAWQISANSSLLIWGKKRCYMKD